MRGLLRALTSPSPPPDHSRVLRIRTDQIATLASSRAATFRQSMLRHIRTHFPAATASFDDHQLEALVSTTIARARRYDLVSEADVCRFLNLAATFGWEFDGDTECAWMQAMLTDPEISAPGDRLRLLVDESVRRLRVHEHNARLRAAFAHRSGG